MSLLVATAGASVRAAGALSPRWGAALAMPLFGRVAKPRPVHADHEPTMARARRGSVTIAGIDRRGVEVDTYEWGAGDRTVLLAHGWDARASQFAPLVRELVADGYRVVAFDAPAHGGSAGRRTYLVDWIHVFAALQQRHGDFEAVVGHSFGGLAALVGVAGGIRSARVVTIAAPADADALLAGFQAGLGYSDAVSRRMRELFASRYFAGDPDPFAWLSSVRRPLPAAVPLLIVHDRGDRLVPFTEAERIAAAHPAARLLPTSGLGHNRLLAADVVLDAVLAHVAGPVADQAPDVAPVDVETRPEPALAASTR
ncbi:alpha/beta fold hydrolase [Microbacterium atlanticum]|uniref:alpha/beta fold hydrolase n=1 Tax=Microbacterium atlanticum TaxID=2782168 RepID=UPI0018891009|nr:alpha/beta fold hydrolase [Microbacterium atlanticum]